MNPHTFEVGEIAIVARASCLPEFPIGSEVTILGIEEPAYNTCFRERQYLVGYLDGVPVVATAKYLRKKPPPREDLLPARWDECPWRPSRVTL